VPHAKDCGQHGGQWDMLIMGRYSSQFLLKAVYDMASHLFTVPRGS
jgi:hypothetical protein